MTAEEQIQEIREGMELSLLNDPDPELPAINIEEKPEINKDRRCCMPSDRDNVKQGDVLVMYCRVCGLIHKKSPIDGDPWESITFVVGEKVNLEEIQAAKA
jgi:hypothetical protein